MHIINSCSVSEFQHTIACTITNVKGNPSGRRKMIPDGNLDLHKEKKKALEIKNI